MTDNTLSPNTVSSENTLATSTRTVTESDLAPKFEGIFAGARDPQTKMRAQELTPDTLISVPMPNGRVMEVPVKAAVRAGLVKVDEDGKFVEVKDEPAQHEPETKRETLSAEHERDVSNLVEACSSAGLDHIQMVGRIIADPDSAPAHLRGLAEKIGADPSEVLNAFNRAYGAFIGQRDAAVRGEGLGPEQLEDFVEWVSSVKPAQGKAAVMRQYAMGDLAPFRALAREFLTVRGYSKRLPEGAQEYRTAKGKGHIKGHLGDRRFAASAAGLRASGLLID